MTLSFYTFKSFSQEQIDSFVSRLSLYVGEPIHVDIIESVNFVTIELSRSLIDYDCLLRIKSALTYIFDEDINYLIQ